MQRENFAYFSSWNGMPISRGYIHKMGHLYIWIWKICRKSALHSAHAFTSTDIIRGAKIHRQILHNIEKIHIEGAAASIEKRTSDWPTARTKCRLGNWRKRISGFTWAMEQKRGTNTPNSKPTRTNISHANGHRKKNSNTNNSIRTAHTNASSQ